MSAWEDGDPGSRICIVGEAPAKEEIKKDTPFVGPSGMVLEECLHSAGLIRRECYTINVFPFSVTKPKGNQEKILYDGDLLWTNKHGFTEKGFEYANQTVKKLHKCKANVFVPMGNTALDLLCDRTAITKWRGSILECVEPGGRKAIPTIHPAATLQGMFLARYAIINDFKKIEKNKKFPELQLPKRTILTGPTFDEAIAFLEVMRKHKAVAFDIECFNYQVSCISFCADPFYGMSIPFIKKGGGAYWSSTDEARIWLKIAELLEDPDIDKIGQNLVFDMQFLFEQNNIIVRGKIHDTMILFSILYPEFPKGLDYLTSIYTDEPYYKEDRKLWHKLDHDLPRFWRYNTRDSLTCAEIWPQLVEEATEQDMKTYWRTIRMLPTLVYMQTRGMAVDKARVKQVKDALEQKIVEAQTELDELTGGLNANSSKQCQEYFYIKKGIKPYTNRKTGALTADDKAMQGIYRKSGLREAKLVQLIRGYVKMKSTYYDVTLDYDDRLRCSYNPRGTKFGRLSSNQTIRDTGLNMLNLPEEFKQFIVADRHGPKQVI